LRWLTTSPMGLTRGGNVNLTPFERKRWRGDLASCRRDRTLPLRPCVGMEDPQDRSRGEMADPASGAQFQRPLCPFPQVARFKVGDLTNADSFECVEDERDRDPRNGD
jgi:hypothetical protein